MNNAISRRTMLKSSLGLVAGASSLLSGGQVFADESVRIPNIRTDAASNAINESYWREITNLYDVSTDIVNLENGYFGVLPKHVLAEYQKNIRELNAHNSFYLRQRYNNDAEKIRSQIAALAGVLPEEIALTRGATESLQNLITNYTRLKPNDTVLYADLDYDSAQSNIDYLKELRGINVAKIVIPEPASYQGIIDTYTQAFTDYPKTKLLLLTHISHKTGLVIPVAEIAKIAKARGIDVLVDGAHSWGHLDFKISDLNVDFGAFTLHKWIGAPLGVGFIYIRKERIADIHPHLITEEHEKGDIRLRVHTGTHNTANVLTIPAALDFHQQIGVANKAARLRYLRDYWVSQAKDIKGVQILTPEDNRLYGAITSFRLVGKTSKEDNQAIVKRLQEQHGIFTVARGGIHAGDSIRITPSIFTRTSDLDKLVLALYELTRG